MALYLGDSKVSKLYLGDTECKKAYLGDTFVLDNSAEKVFQWVSSTLPRSTYWTCIASGNSKFVAGIYGSSSNFSIYAYSSDGINWVEHTLPKPGKWEKCIYAGGKFVLLGTNSSTADKTIPPILYSIDGLNWEISDANQSGTLWESIAYGNGVYVIVASALYTGSYILYSTDLVKWEKPSKYSVRDWKSVTYGNGKFVAVANKNGNYYTDSSMYSIDNGKTWIDTKLPVSADWQIVTYGKGHFLAIAQGSSIAAYSDDGIIWTKITLPISANWTSCTYGNGRFVLVATSSSTTTLISKDGISWDKVTIPSGHWYDVAYGAGKFVTIGYNVNADLKL